MGVLTGGLAVVAGAAKAVEFIPNGVVAVKVRGGRFDRRFDSLLHKKKKGDFYGYRGKGMALSIPFFERYVQLNIEENTEELPELLVTSKEKLQMVIGSAAAWHIIGEGDNPYKALMRLNNPHTSNNLSELRQKVTIICAEGVSTVMKDMPVAQMSNFREISGNVKDHTNEELLEYGVNLNKMHFKLPYESPAEVARQGNILAAQELAAAVRESGQSQTLAAMALSAVMERSQPEQVIHGPQLAETPLHLA